MCASDHKQVSLKKNNPKQILSINKRFRKFNNLIKIRSVIPPGFFMSRQNREQLKIEF
jgi:hypothetical protein